MVPWEEMARTSDSQEERRKDALTAFIDERVREGYRIESRTDTHAIIAPAHEGRSLLDRVRRPKASSRQVISVDEDGEVSMRPAEPLRS